MTQAIFDNIEGFISSQINQAEKRISIAVAWFTNQTLFDSMLNAAQREVEIKIIIMNDILNRNEFGLDFGIIANKNAEIRFAVNNSGTMHHKFSIIDNNVISGSYNWTYHANKNDENIIVTDDENVVNTYIKQFDKLFSHASPLNVPYEHLKWTDIKEGDFSQMRRYIFREGLAKNDVYWDLKRTKLLCLDRAYKSGSMEDLTTASSLPISGNLKTITDVLTNRYHDYQFKLWEENIGGEPYDSYGSIDFINWFYFPYQVTEDQFHCEYISGALKTESVYCRSHILSKGMKLNIYDKDYVALIKKYVGTEPISWKTRQLIPIELLRIKYAKKFFYKFPSPLFNKSQPKTWKGGMPRTIPSINVLGIAKEINEDNIVFYDGWDPQKRGEKIVNQFFEKK